ncbi:HSP20-like chaperone, partial [Globomyces pollinis-pini]
FLVSVDVPGYNKDQINVQFRDNVMEISGAQERDNEMESGRFVYRERMGREFTRQVRLPDTVDADKVTANMMNGVLHVTVPKGTFNRKSITIQ